MTHVSLFAGIGGLDLAAEWAGFETVLQVEIDDYANRVLQKHWPNVKRIKDIRDVNRESVSGAVTVISGGFPCQPFSQAGKREGRQDNRYLWPEMLRVIHEFSPTWVIGENVSGLLSINDGLEIEHIISQLEGEEYEVLPLVYPVAGVGAPHRRERVFIIAYSRHSAGESKRKCKQEVSEKLRASGEGQIYAEDVADTGRKHEQGNTTRMEAGKTERTTCELSIESGDKGYRTEQWKIEPDVGGTFDGFPCWLYRHCGKGMSYAESKRRTEALQNLWSRDVSKKIWWHIGGYDRIQKAEILFSFVCKYERNPNEAWIFLESKKALERFLRGLYLDGEPNSPPYRSGCDEQQSGEHTDAMQTLPRLLAHSGEENWQISSWEDAIPRISTGVKNRVDRLKCLGNAVVPQQAYPLFKAIAEVENIRR